MMDVVVWTIAVMWALVLLCGAWVYPIRHPEQNDVAILRRRIRRLRNLRKEMIAAELIIPIGFFYLFNRIGARFLLPSVLLAGSAVIAVRTFTNRAIEQLEDKLERLESASVNVEGGCAVERTDTSKTEFFDT